MTNTTITRETASKALFAIATRDTDKLQELGIRVYGNKGRSWTNTACITNLDSIKGECNPRLASNWCELEHVGCPKCIATLQQIAEGSRSQPAPEAKAKATRKHPIIRRVEEAGYVIHNRSGSWEVYDKADHSVFAEYRRLSDIPSDAPYV